MLVLGPAPRYASHPAGADARRPEGVRGRHLQHRGTLDTYPTALFTWGSPPPRPERLLNRLGTFYRGRFLVDEEHTACGRWNRVDANRHLVEGVKVQREPD
ncbi:uncharacterized protein LOC143040893 [Oratosquilla oratoria]|uniref:uncharacterized protein LOC143040893 n=1 Tax=Oratosquilla oratoria TaxID=337810 RepID=UPI003F771AE7